MKNIFQSENCLSLDSMRLYKDGKLTARNAHAVEKHLLECSLCAEAFDSLDLKRMAEVEKVSTRVNRRLATYMNTPPRLGFFQRFGFTITAGALILAAGGGVAIWMHNQEKPEISDSAHQNNQTTPVAKNSPGNTETFSQELTQNDPANPVKELAEANNSGNENAGEAKKKETLREPDKGSGTPVNTTRQPENDPLTTRNTTPENNTHTPSENNGSTTRTPSTDPVVVLSSRLTMKVSANANEGTATGKMSDGQFVRTNKKKKNEQTLDEMPQFPNGDWTIGEFIGAKFKPVKADRAAIKNYTAMVIVTVSSKGKVTNVEMMRGVHKDIDAELIRVLNNMPLWASGKGDIDATLVVTFE